MRKLVYSSLRRTSKITLSAIPTPTGNRLSFEVIAKLPGALIPAKAGKRSLMYIIQFFKHVAKYSGFAFARE
jgi:hypothetical protein